MFNTYFAFEKLCSNGLFLTATLLLRVDLKEVFSPRSFFLLV